MGYIHFKRHAQSEAIRFKTDYSSELYMNPKFLEHLCFSGSLDNETLLDSMAERVGRHYRLTAKVVDYEKYMEGISGESHVMFLVHTKDQRIFDGIDAYLYAWDTITKEHYLKRIERYVHTSRLYQIDSGYLPHIYPIDK